MVALLGAVLYCTQWGSSASGHEARSFDACAKAYRISVPCRTRTEAGSGVKVVIRGHIRPSHEGKTARVWRQEPHSNWQKVAFVKVRSGGKFHWYWTPSDDDIYNYTPWRFRFAIPGHGQSNIARVLVRSSDF
jgi:hypothetical protein